jgi:Fe2+ or Zn2+ uptake regulation protein
MKLYCARCEKDQPVAVDNSRDIDTNERHQDIVCTGCGRVIASSRDCPQRPAQTRTSQKLEFLYD